MKRLASNRIKQNSRIEVHSINSTDAVVLRSALDMCAFERERGNKLMLVTADKRLASAAKTESLDTINPELTELSEIPALLA